MLPRPLSVRCVDFRLECTDDDPDIGADLVTVYCAEEAVIPIKCYSPELMVLPIYSDRYIYSTADNTTSETVPQQIQSAADVIIQSMERMHVLVIGPGLGIRQSSSSFKHLPDHHPREE